MNTTFNINRLGLLLKRFFMENKQRELTFWGIATVVFMLSHKALPVTMFLFIAGFIFAARTFKIFAYSPGGMHYLLIPATHLEKLITNILLSTFYYFCMFLVTYTIGTTIGITLGNQIFDTHNPIYFDLFQSGNITNHMALSQTVGLWDIFFAFAISQSIFLVGSLYFKRNAIAGTFLTIIALSIVLGFIEAFLFRVTFGSFNLGGQSIKILASNGENNLLPELQVIGNIFKYTALPFWWVVSYFRLTEKEI